MYRFERPNTDAFPGTSRKENECDREEFRETGESQRSSSRNSDSGYFSIHRLARKLH